jgi:hypothetical protein
LIECSTNIYMPCNFLKLSFKKNVIIVLGGGTLWYLQKFLYQIYLNSRPLSFPFICHSPIPGTILYTYLHVYTVFASYLPPYILSPPLPSPIDTNRPGRTCSALLFFDFVKERKKLHFLFVWDNYTVTFPCIYVL